MHEAKETRSQRETLERETRSQREIAEELEEEVEAEQADVGETEENERLNYRTHLGFWHQPIPAGVDVRYRCWSLRDQPEGSPKPVGLYVRQFDPDITCIDIVKRRIARRCATEMSPQVGVSPPWVRTHEELQIPSREHIPPSDSWDEPPSREGEVPRKKRKTEVSPKPAGSSRCLQKQVSESVIEAATLAEPKPAGSSRCLQKQVSESVIEAAILAEELSRLPTGEQCTQAQIIEIDSDSCATTEIELGSCEIDSDSCTTTEIESVPCATADLDSVHDMAPSGGDSLLQMAIATPRASESSLSQSSFDSELTENYDPNVPAPSISCEADREDDLHWSHSSSFKDAVADHLNGYKYYPAITCEGLAHMPLHSFEECFSRIVVYILQNICPACDQFKIGITENAVVRYNLTYLGNEWGEMHVLYCAPTSKWNIHKYMSDERKMLMSTSTGTLESALIKQFRGESAAERHPQLYNRGAGGECPSNGSPHFLYVICRHCEDEL